MRWRVSAWPTAVPAATFHLVSIPHLNTTNHLACGGGLPGSRSLCARRSKAAANVAARRWSRFNDRSEAAAAALLDQMDDVQAVGLAVVSGPAGDRTGSDHRALEAIIAQRALQYIRSAGALVAGSRDHLLDRAVKPAADGVQVARQANHLGLNGISVQACRGDRYRRTMKNVAKLQNCRLPGDLAFRLASFVECHDTERHRESVEIMTPAGHSRGPER